jgi:hypothetical protein
MAAAARTASRPGEKDEHVPYIPILKGDKLLAVLQLNQVPEGLAHLQINRSVTRTLFLWTMAEK